MPCGPSEVAPRGRFGGRPRRRVHVAAGLLHVEPHARQAGDFHAHEVALEELQLLRLDVVDTRRFFGGVEGESAAFVRARSHVQQRFDAFATLERTVHPDVAGLERVAPAVEHEHRNVDLRRSRDRRAFLVEGVVVRVFQVVEGDRSARRLFVLGRERARDHARFAVGREEPGRALHGKVLRVEGQRQDASRVGGVVVDVGERLVGGDRREVRRVLLGGEVLHDPQVGAAGHADLAVGPRLRPQELDSVIAVARLARREVVFVEVALAAAGAADVDDGEHEAARRVVAGRFTPAHARRVRTASC